MITLLALGPFLLVASSPAAPEAGPCQRLAEVRKLPFKELPTDDDVYNAIVADAPRSIPCLIERIMDTRPMPDPRQSPHVYRVAVGDTAVFILSNIAGYGSFAAMLPPDVRKAYDELGMDGYFKLMERPGYRKELQLSWARWHARERDRLDD